MATVEIIIRDEHGNILESADKRLYEWDIGNGSFHEIEGAVEAFKHAALSAIEQDLLRQRQEKFTEEIKKSAVQL